MTWMCCYERWQSLVTICKKRVNLEESTWRGSDSRGPFRSSFKGQRSQWQGSNAAEMWATAGLIAGDLTKAKRPQAGCPQISFMAHVGRMEPEQAAECTEHQRGPFMGGQVGQAPGAEQRHDGPKALYVLSPSGRWQKRFRVTAETKTQSQGLLIVRDGLLQSQPRL